MCTSLLLSITYFTFIFFLLLLFFLSFLLLPAIEYKFCIYFVDGQLLPFVTQMLILVQISGYTEWNKII